MAESGHQIATTSEILGASPARDLLQDIFADLHPAFIDESRDLDQHLHAAVGRRISLSAHQL